MSLYYVAPEVSQGGGDLGEETGVVGSGHFYGGVVGWRKVVVVDNIVVGIGLYDCVWRSLRSFYGLPCTRSNLNITITILNIRFD